MESKFHLRDSILSSIGTVVVDTCFVFDGNRFETLVLKSNSSNEINWSEPLDCWCYYTEEDARKGHQSLISKWEV